MDLRLLSFRANIGSTLQTMYNSGHMNYSFHYRPVRRRTPRWIVISNNLAITIKLVHPAN